jgi:hypothetical protein
VYVCVYMYVLVLTLSMVESTSSNQTMSLEGSNDSISFAVSFDACVCVLAEHFDDATASVLRRVSSERVAERVSIHYDVMSV